MGLVFYTAMVAQAFVPTFLISRVIFRLTKQWEGSMERLVATNVASGILCVAIFIATAEILSDGEPYPWGIPVVAYIAAQGIWLALDILTDRSRSRVSTSL